MGLVTSTYVRGNRKAIGLYGKHPPAEEGKGNLTAKCGMTK